MTNAFGRSCPIELLKISPCDLKGACDLLAHDLLGNSPLGLTPSHQLREAILSQVLFESISRQQRKEARDESDRHDHRK